MGRYFVQKEDEVGPGGDISFRKGHPKYRWYRVFVGDKCFGMVMENGPRKSVRWNALSYAKKSDWCAIRSMNGFATRMDAATFIIKHHGYWMQNEHYDGE